MNEKLQQELISSIEVVKEYVTKGANFASEQAPLVIDELIKFHLYYEGAFIILSFILGLVTMWFFKIGKNIISTEGDLDSPQGALTIFGGALTAIFGLIFFFSSLKTFVMCFTAPRLFIIQYLKDLL